MIGNDIIDLKEAWNSSNWKRRGFLNKVFSQAEQTVIHQAENPFETVWRLWSMKESAYKFYFQKNPSAVRGFYPAKITCQILTPSIGRVHLHGLSLKTKTVSQVDYIFSLAFSTTNVSAGTDIFYLSEKNQSFQSTFVKKKLINYLKQTKQMKSVDLKIIKDENNIPRIYRQAEKLPLACSLTHHGNYGAFTVVPIDNQ